MTKMNFDLSKLDFAYGRKPRSNIVSKPAYLGVHIEIRDAKKGSYVTMKFGAIGEKRLCLKNHTHIAIKRTAEDPNTLYLVPTNDGRKSNPSIGRLEKTNTCYLVRFQGKEVVKGLKDFASVPTKSGKTVYDYFITIESDLPRVCAIRMGNPYQSQEEEG